jgi:hypothetical protein
MRLVGFGGLQLDLNANRSAQLQVFVHGMLWNMPVRRAEIVAIARHLYLIPKDKAHRFVEHFQTEVNFFIRGS